MSAHDGVTFTIKADGTADIQTQKSPRENVGGFITQFRQLYAKDESASYSDVVGIISRLTRTTTDSFQDRRQDILSAWRRAHGRLLQQRVEAIVARKHVNSAYVGQGDSPTPIPFEHARPTELISRYMYGEYIHYGEKREALQAFRKSESELIIELDYLNFLEAAIGLAHYYLGFSILATRAFKLSA